MCISICTVHPRSSTPYSDFISIISINESKSFGAEFVHRTLTDHGDYRYAYYEQRHLPSNIYSLQYLQLWDLRLKQHDSNGTQGMRQNQ